MTSLKQITLPKHIVLEKKLPCKISAYTFPKLLFMDFLVQMEPEKPLSSELSTKLHKQILAKFSSMEKNLILITLKTSVTCRKKEDCTKT